jgi:hypothetical protein
MRVVSYNAATRAAITVSLMKIGRLGTILPPTSTLGALALAPGCTSPSGSATAPVSSGRDRTIGTANRICGFVPSTPPGDEYCAGTVGDCAAALPSAATTPLSCCAARGLAVMGYSYCRGAGTIDCESNADELQSSIMTASGTATDCRESRNVFFGDMTHTFRNWENAETVMPRKSARTHSKIVRSMKDRICQPKARPHHGSQQLHLCGGLAPIVSDRLSAHFISELAHGQNIPQDGHMEGIEGSRRGEFCASGAIYRAWCGLTRRSRDIQSLRGDSAAMHCCPGAWLSTLALRIPYSDLCPSFSACAKSSSALAVSPFFS